jgi:hypothetical protein
VLQLISSTRLARVTLDVVYKQVGPLSRAVALEVRKFAKWFKKEAKRAGREVQVQAWVKPFLAGEGDLVSDDEDGKIEG